MRTNDLRLVEAPQLTLSLAANQDLEIAFVDVARPIAVDAISVHGLNLLCCHMQVQFPPENNLRRVASAAEVPTVATLVHRLCVSIFTPLFTPLDTPLYIARAHLEQMAQKGPKQPRLTALAHTQAVDERQRAIHARQRRQQKQQEPLSAKNKHLS